MYYLLIIEQYRKFIGIIIKTYEFPVFFLEFPMNFFKFLMNFLHFMKIHLVWLPGWVPGWLARWLAGASGFHEI